LGILGEEIPAPYYTPGIVYDLRMHIYVVYMYML